MMKFINDSWQIWASNDLFTLQFGITRCKIFTLCKAQHFLTSSSSYFWLYRQQNLFQFPNLLSCSERKVVDTSKNWEKIHPSLNSNPQLSIFETTNDLYLGEILHIHPNFNVFASICGRFSATLEYNGDQNLYNTSLF